MSDQVARDVEALAQLEREIVGVWLPRLKEAQVAVARLEAAEYPGAAGLGGVLDGEHSENSPAAIAGELRALREGEGDELWYQAVCRAHQMDWNSERMTRTGTLHDTLLEVGRQRFLDALHAMRPKDQVDAMQWLVGEGSGYCYASPPPAAAQLYSAAAGITVEPGEPERFPDVAEVARNRRLAAALPASVKR